MKLTIESLDTISQTAKQFIEQMGNNSVFAFYGNMGVGKTTFIKAICEELGVRETVNSPTFAIINEYTTKEGKPVYHFDFYRIGKQEEALDFGYEDYVYSGNICFIEWPEKIVSLLPENIINITITEAENGKREISLT